uniref:(northern house mosquito) hypothetical protein n=1 Tax=Culex pipiens TaxID=7175 RepID=A0A8D8CGL6_CULPI
MVGQVPKRARNVRGKPSCRNPRAYPEGRLRVQVRAKQRQPRRPRLTRTLPGSTDWESLLVPWRVPRRKRLPRRRDGHRSRTTRSTSCSRCDNRRTRRRLQQDLHTVQLVPSIQ